MNDPVALMELTNLILARKDLTQDEQLRTIALECAERVDQLYSVEEHMMSKSYHQQRSYLLFNRLIQQDVEE